MATMTTNADIVRDLLGFFAQGPVRDFTPRQLYELVTAKLNEATGEHWTYRYIEGVLKGQVTPSQRFMEAVALLGSSLEGGRPAAYEGTELVEVFALPDRVRPGALIVGASKPCENSACRVHFVPTVPWAKFCPACRKPRRRK